MIIQKKYNTNLAHLIDKYKSQPEFLQAVSEVYASLQYLFKEDEKYLTYFNYLVEPEKIIQFKVVWYDDQDHLQTNTGYRIQFNSALGPYKGGLRFDKSVNLSILKFLAFEQMFKNALTGLWLGAGKGGSDFNPTDKSNAEIRRFCQAFMLQLHSHIGAETDVPAGDMNVGGREIGHMYQTYKLIRNNNQCVLTGKAPNCGGSFIRTEATGYGLVYFVLQMLQAKELNNLRAVVSGSGNVAQHAAEKLLQVGAKVTTLSDRSGVLYFENGLDATDLQNIKQLKKDRKKLTSFTSSNTFVLYKDKTSPWQFVKKVDLVLPCARQNELDQADAQHLLLHGCRLVAEGANMPCTPAAIELFEKKGILYAGGKMTNAGGVAVSGLEMAQDAAKYRWSKQEVDQKLRNIMQTIYQDVKANMRKYNCTLMDAGNITAFLRVVDGTQKLGLFNH